MPPLQLARQLRLAFTSLAESLWMVLRVAETTLIRLTSRIIPLSEVIPNASRDDFIYFLDISSDN